MAKVEKIIHGDSLDVLKTMEDNSVDSVCCDPPYGLSKEPDINEVLTKWLAGEEYDHGHGGFMGKTWDSFVPHPDIWREVYRVLKPGGHALVFAGTRTQDLMTISLRLAGFEVRDVIEWLYATGFPKSHDVSKAFDRRAGKEREVIGRRTDGRYAYEFSNKSSWHGQGDFGTGDKGLMTAPATDLAKQWDGWGTSLKPSHEPIIVVRKPLIDADTGRKLTVADCVEKYGTGAINIDACRIGESGATTKADTSAVTESNGIYGDGLNGNCGIEMLDKGRFPANCITLDSDEFYSKYFNVASAQEAQPNVTPAELSKKASKKDRNSDWKGEEIALEEKRSVNVAGGGGIKGSCSKHGKGLRSGESRYPCGCDVEYVKKKGVINRNHHPTVKPTDLMAWLVRLITPLNGVVLDPFAGSGSTLVAAKREGFGFIGVELTEEYIPIIEARVGAKATGVEHIEARTNEIECDSCDGLGEIMTDDYATHTCVTCDGRGHVINDEGQATE